MNSDEIHILRGISVDMISRSRYHREQLNLEIGGLPWPLPTTTSSAPSS